MFSAWNVKPRVTQNIVHVRGASNPSFRVATLMTFCVFWQVVIADRRSRAKFLLEAMPTYRKTLRQEPRTTTEIA